MPKLPFMDSSFYNTAMREINLGIPESESTLNLKDKNTKIAYDRLKKQMDEMKKDNKIIDMPLEQPDVS